MKKFHEFVALAWLELIGVAGDGVYQGRQE